MRYFMEAHEHRAAAIAVQAVAAAQRSRSAAWAMDWVAESVLVLSMYKLLLVMEPARIATKRRVAAVQQVSRPGNRRNRRTRRCPAHSHHNGEHVCAYWSGRLNPIADVQRPTQPSEADLQAQVRDKFLGNVWQGEGIVSGESVTGSGFSPA